jgi:hypothetical protein
MSYALRVDAVQQLVWDCLPQTASEGLTLALGRVCDDPLGETDPYGEDDGVMRLLILASLVVVLLVSHATKRIHIMQITFLG